MRKNIQARLLIERSLDGDEKRSAARSAADGAGDSVRKGRPIRSITVNLAESPLGWLFARGHLDRVQFEAGERVRADWERGQLAPGVTMKWDSARLAKGRGGAAVGPDLTAAQIDARARFDAAIVATGPGLADIVWRVVCAGEGMREAETALGWPARAGKVVLTLALDRLAIYYRIG